MRVRALGMAMCMFGIAGAIASFGLWWMLYRYAKSINDAAGAPLPCTQHCGAVDGPYLAGLVVSAALAVVGLVLAMAARTSSKPAADRS